MDINNPILKVSREHDILMNYVVNFDRHLKNRAFQALFATVKEANTFLQRDLWNHFRAEETVLFPALLAAEPTYENIETILKLERAHGTLWAMAERIFEEFDFGGRGQGPTMAFVTRVQEFLELIKAHARVEITQVFPRIAASEEATANVERFTSKFQPSAAPGAEVESAAASGA